MAKTVGIKIEGLKELRSELRKIDKRLPRELQKGNKEAAKSVLPKVRRGAPVGATGRLAKSVRPLATQRRAQVGVGFERRVPYAGVINFGWAAHNIRPQEFIYRGINKSTRELLKAYAKMIDRLTKKAFPN